jgi:uncharacterized membrane protein
MFFLPIPIALFILFILLMPLLFALAPAVAFAKLGLNPFCGYAFFILCLVGSGINIPIHKEELHQITPQDELTLLVQRFLGIRIPHVGHRVIAINVGGAVLPVLLSIYLIGKTPLDLILAGTLITTVASYLLSKPVKGVGIVMPAFVPPIIAAITALILTREYAPQVAYVSGVLGTLLGADIIRLPQLRHLEAQFLSIGGAGVFDGIYLVGLVSVLLA